MQVVYYKSKGIDVVQDGATMRTVSATDLFNKLGRNFKLFWKEDLSGAVIRAEIEDSAKVPALDVDTEKVEPKSHDEIKTILDATAF